MRTSRPKAQNEASKKAKGSGTLDRNPVADAAAVKMARRSRFNPLRNLSPQSLVHALDAFEIGNLRDAATLWAQMRERDDVLSVVAPKREKSVSRRKWEVLTTGEESESKAAEAQKQALEYFWNNATAVNAFDKNERGKISQVFRQFLRTISFKYGAQHLVWKPSPHGLTAEFEYVPLEFFENTTGELRWLGPMGFAAEGKELDPQNWIISCNDGLMKPCSIAYGFKVLSYLDWVAYNEKFGLPFPIGKTNAPKDSDEWNDMVEAVGNIMNDGAAVMSMDAAITTLEVKSSGLPFAPLIERCDRAMSAIYTGADLATISRVGAQNAGASVQAGEPLKFEADDCAWLSEQLQRIDQMVLEYTFGVGVEVLAYTQVRGPITRDVRGDLEVDDRLIRWGVPISKADLAERYERTMAEDDEEKAGGIAEGMAAKERKEHKDTDKKDIRDLGANERSPEEDRRVREGLQEDLRGVREAFARALQATDADLEEALRQFDAGLPVLLDEVMRGTGLERALEGVLATAFVEGMDLGAVIEDAGIGITTGG